MQLSEAISQRLSKKGSFAAADGIKPRAPPPKPRRTFEKLPETAQESIKMPPESASPHKPSVTVTSPAHQGSKTPPITYPLIQNRPLPSVPQVDGDSPYVCDITLNLSKCKHTNQLPPTHPPPLSGNLYISICIIATATFPWTKRIFTFFSIKIQKLGYPIPFRLRFTNTIGDQPWFYKTMDRPEAERLLKQVGSTQSYASN